jgi:hypothetical protein
MAISSPTDISGCVQWSDYTDLTDGAVAQWSDKSGNSNHWTQATTTKQPVKSSSGILFDGTTDNLRCSNLNSLFTGLEKEHTIFIVAKPTSISSVATLFSAASTSSSFPRVTYRLNTGKAEFFRRGNSGESSNVTITSSEVETNNTTHIFTANHNSNTQTNFWVDGNARHLFFEKAISTMTIDRVTIGAHVRTTEVEFWSGYFYEIIIYSRFLTLSERTDVEAYLANKYNVTVTVTDPNTAFDTFASWWTLPRAVGTASYGTWIGGVAVDGRNVISNLGGSGARITGYGGYNPDDHNTIGLLAPEDKVPIAFITGHGSQSTIRVRKGPSIGDFSSLSAVTSLTTSAGSSYTQAYNRPGTNEGIIFSRVTSFKWSLFWTDDYFTTFGTERAFLVPGGTSQFYMATRQLSDGNLRAVCYGHPTLSSVRDIYYCHINLETGDVTKVDGTVIGNVKTGANLPLSHTSWDKAYDVLSGIGSRLFDISDGPEIEIAFATWTGDGSSNDTTYKYLRYDGSQWVTHDVCLSGAPFGYKTDTQYVGGMSFPEDSPGGIVYLSREENSVWTIEKWSTANNGSSWATTVLATSPSGHKYIRPYALKSTDQHPLTYIDCTNYGGNVDDAYLTYAGNIVALTSVADSGGGITGYTFSGPEEGTNGVASDNFTITFTGGTTTGAESITISDGNLGGTITPSTGSAGVSSITVTPSSSTSSFTFTYTPAVAGTITITTTNNQSWTNPSTLEYISTNLSIGGPGLLSSPFRFS